MTTPEPVDPIPADDAPHAYVVVRRTHSAWADRPEWAGGAFIVPAHEADEIEHWRKQGYTLIPIGPDGDTGTRAISTEEIEVADFQAACKSACEQRDAALEQLAAVRTLATNWATQWGAANPLLASAGTQWQIQDGREILAILDGPAVSDGQ